MVGPADTGDCSGSGSSLCGQRGRASKRTDDATQQRRGSQVRNKAEKVAGVRIAGVEPTGYFCEPGSVE